MQLYIWRHPKPKQVQGLCFGQSEVAVDRRKLKRLAHQIQRFVRVNQLPKQIWVSPLQRSQQVGEYLAAQGFECYVDDRLLETHFGAWEGKPWSQISKEDIDNWCDNFADFAPTGGESLRQLFQRVAAWIEQQKQPQAELDNSNFKNNSNSESNDKSAQNNKIENNNKADSNNKTVLVVGHAGWINTAKLIHQGQSVPTKAIHWPAAVCHGELTYLQF